MYIYDISSLRVNKVWFGLFNLIQCAFLFYSSKINWVNKTTSKNKTKTICVSVNHTRFPKEDHLPDWAHRDNWVGKYGRVEPHKTWFSSSDMWHCVIWCAVLKSLKAVSAFRTQESAQPASHLRNESSKTLFSGSPVCTSWTIRYFQLLRYTEVH